jgi:hypothetical protein
MISMAIMHEGLAKDLPPQMLGNFDATQFILTFKNNEMLITIKRKSHPT